MTDVVTPTDAVHAASDVTYASTSEVQTDSSSQRNAGETFQFDAELEPTGVGPELFTVSSLEREATNLCSGSGTKLEEAIRDTI